jgi:hypothetical protein
MAKHRRTPPPGFAHAEAPADVAPAIAATLKAGWRVAAERGAFESARGERLDVAAALPGGSRVVYTVPALAAADVAALSAPERELARHILIVLPPGADAAKLVPAVRSWTCIERAQVAPRPALP